MSRYLFRLNEAVRSHDSELFVIEADRKTGLKQVLRRSYKGAHPPHVVFHLTHNWTPQGRPVEWGIEPIIAHLKECDLWGRNVVEEYIKQSEEKSAEQDRDRRNKIESFLYDYAGQFRKTHAYTITHSKY